jgi:hypothetical protein
MHGTAGIRGVNASVHASAGDLLSQVDFGLMGTVEARKNRWVLPADLMWVRLEDNHSLPRGLLGINSIDFTSWQLVFTPKAGYRIVDNPKLKVDGLAGLRYWYLSNKLSLNPPIRNGVTASDGWVDALGGARVVMLLRPKLSVALSADAGGGGGGPDYQLVGLLGYRVRKRIVVQGGWRYLDVHYRNNNQNFLYDMVQSGVAAGATFYLR